MTKGCNKFIPWLQHQANVGWGSCSGPCLVISKIILYFNAFWMCFVFCLSDWVELFTGNLHGLGVGEDEINKPLECLEKKVFNNQGVRTADIWNASGKWTKVTMFNQLQTKKCKRTLLSANVQWPRWGYSQKELGQGCAARFPKPFPYLCPKSAIFPTLFMTWPKIRYLIYDQIPY